MNPDEETTEASAVAVEPSAIASGEVDEVLRKIDEKLAARIQAFRESERLSEEDFAIRINARE